MGNGLHASRVSRFSGGFSVLGFTTHGGFGGVGFRVLGLGFTVSGLGFRGLGPRLLPLPESRKACRALRYGNSTAFDWRADSGCGTVQN